PGSDEDITMWKNTLKRYEILSDDDVRRIHEHAMLILSEIGVDFLHPKALHLLNEAGMKVEDRRVRFDPAWVMAQVKQAPSMFEVQARNPKKTITIGGDFMVNAPTSGPPFITDLDLGRRGGRLGLVNLNSPLRDDVRMLGALLEYAAANQPVLVTPFLMAGAMSPMGLAGTIAQQTAEALAGIALIQVVRPGAPCIYGSFLTNTDMQSGSPSFGTPESALGILASAQM